MAFIYNLLDTWNNAGTVFSAIKLNVTNTASAAGSKLIDLQIGGSTFFNVDKSGQVALLAGTAAAPTLIPTGDTNTGIWFPSADTIAASTGGSERLRIGSSGNVAIGTTAPDALLSVNGIASFGAGAAATPSLAAFGDLNTGMWFPAADTIAWSTGGSERVRISSVGRVGFGTDAPDSRIEVVSTTADIYARSSSATGYADIGAVRSDFYSGPSYASTTLRQFGASRTGTSFGLSNAGLGLIVFQNTTNAAIGTNGTTPLIFATLDAERVRINSSGNVGIGTTAPDALLSVNGIASFGAGAAGTPSIAAFGDLNTGMWFPAADTVAWSTNGSERMRLHASGGVSIGNTTDPGAGALIVNSTIQGTQIRGGYNDTTGVANTAAQALGTNTVSKVLISADTTLTSTVPPAGAHASVIIQTSGTTSRTVTFGTGFKSQGTLATGATASRFWVVNFVSDGTSLFETSRTTTAYA